MIIINNPEHNEGCGEFVKTLFPDKFKGICVDIGAYHSTWLSNSWVFEKDGWDTYCIEPNVHCIAELQKNRKKVFNFAIDSKNDDNGKLYVYEKKGLGMASDTGLKIKDIEDKVKEVQDVKVITLKKFVEDQKIDHIDFLSIDTEGKEFDILSSIDLRDLKVKVIVSESIKVEEHRQQKEYLNFIGFYFVKRIVYNDIYIGKDTWIYS